MNHELYLHNTQIEVPELLVPLPIQYPDQQYQEYVKLSEAKMFAAMQVPVVPNGDETYSYSSHSSTLWPTGNELLAKIEEVRQEMVDASWREYALLENERRLTALACITATRIPRADRSPTGYGGA